MDNPRKERKRLLGRVLSAEFFPLRNCRQTPQVSHLSSAVDFLHQLVVEIMRNFLAFSCPQNKFRRMGEKPARKIRRRIRLCPSDAIQNAEVQLVQHLRNRKNIVVSARNPDCAVVLQMRAAGRNPLAVEVVVLFKALRFVPAALVHAHLLPRLNGDYRQGVSLTSFRSGYPWLRTHFVLSPFLRFASERLRRHYYP